MLPHDVDEAYILELNSFKGDWKGNTVKLLSSGITRFPGQGGHAESITALRGEGLGGLISL